VNCREVREGLWPPERPRLLSPDVERAREHVRACPECASYFAQDRALLAACHRLRALRAPLGVRTSTFGALARTRRELDAPVSVDGRRSGPWLKAAAVGGVLAASVGIALGLWMTDPASVAESVTSPAVAAVTNAESAFVEDYLRRAVGEDYLESSDPELIASFLRREFGLEFHMLGASGLIPARVEICLLEGRRAAMIVYRLDGRRVTHYLVPRAGDVRQPRVARGHGGLAVVSWSSRYLEEALVGEVRPDELLALAPRAVVD